MSHISSILLRTLAFTIAFAVAAPQDSLSQALRPSFMKIGDSLNLAEERPTLALNPPYAPKLGSSSMQEIFGGATNLVLYTHLDHPTAKTDILELKQRGAAYKKIKPVLILHTRGEQDTAKATEFVGDAQIDFPVILDPLAERYFLTRLSAFRPPHFAVIDNTGKLLINKVTSLQSSLTDGTKFLNALIAHENGADLPMSDGELVQNVLSLKGNAIGKAVLPKADVGGAERAQIDTSKLAAIGKPALFVYWIATCPHCQKEMPKIWEWYQKHKSEVELVTVTRLEKPSATRYTESYLAKTDLRDMPVYKGDQHAFQTFRIQAFPSWAMVAANGIVVEANQGSAPGLSSALDAALDKANKQPKPSADAVQKANSEPEESAKEEAPEAAAAAESEKQEAVAPEQNNSTPASSSDSDSIPPILWIALGVLGVAALFSIFKK